MRVVASEEEKLRPSVPPGRGRRAQPRLMAPVDQARKVAVTSMVRTPVGMFAVAVPWPTVASGEATASVLSGEMPLVREFQVLVSDQVVEHAVEAHAGAGAGDLERQRGAGDGGAEGDGAEGVGEEFVEAEEGFALGGGGGGLVVDVEGGGGGEVGVGAAGGVGRLTEQCVGGIV